MINLLFFFFSSRRRHTRLQGDWSSDVCSSDLPCLAPLRSWLRARPQDSPPAESPRSNDGSTPAADPVPTMFPHPETDRWWISGQANFISQWPPSFHSP